MYITSSTTLQVYNSHFPLQVIRKTFAAIEGGKNRDAAPVAMATRTSPTPHRTKTYSITKKIELYFAQLRCI